MSLPIISVFFPCFLSVFCLFSFRFSLVFFPFRFQEEKKKGRHLSRDPFCETPKSLTRNCPHPNRLLKCLPNCLLPHKRGFFSSFEVVSAVRLIARQLRGNNCLAAIFCLAASRCLFGPSGWVCVWGTCTGVLQEGLQPPGRRLEKATF